jgi:hypothetical protein
VFLVEKESQTLQIINFASTNFNSAITQIIVLVDLKKLIRVNLYNLCEDFFEAI